MIVLAHRFLAVSASPLLPPPSLPPRQIRHESRRVRARRMSELITVVVPSADERRSLERGSSPRARGGAVKIRRIECGCDGKIDSSARGGKLMAGFKTRNQGHTSRKTDRARRGIQSSGWIHARARARTYIAARTYGRDESRPPRDALRICMPAAGSEKRRGGLFNKIFHADEWPCQKPPSPRGPRAEIHGDAAREKATPRDSPRRPRASALPPPANFIRARTGRGAAENKVTALKVGAIN